MSASSAYLATETSIVSPRALPTIVMISIMSALRPPNTPARRPTIVLAILSLRRRPDTKSTSVSPSSSTPTMGRISARSASRFSRALSASALVTRRSPCSLFSVAYLTASFLSSTAGSSIAKNSTTYLVVRVLRKLITPATAPSALRYVIT